MVIIFNSSACFCRFVSLIFFFFVIRKTKDLFKWESKLTFVNSSTNERDIYSTNKISKINEANFNPNLQENLMYSISQNSKNDSNYPDSINLRYDSDFVDNNMKDNKIFSK